MLRNSILFKHILIFCIYVICGSALGISLTKVYVEGYFRFIWTTHYSIGILLGLITLVVSDILTHWNSFQDRLVSVFSIKHAQCYLPLLILPSVFMLDILPVNEYHGAFIDYLYTTGLFGFCISTVLFLKVYKKNSDNKLGKISDSGKSKNEAVCSSSLDKIIFILFLFSTIYFYCLLHTTNKVLTDDSHYYYNMISNLSQFSLSYSGSDLDIPTHIFGTHLNLILIPVALIYKIFPTIDFLILLQSLIIASAVIPLSKLGRKKTGNRMIGYAVAISFLLHPAIQLGHNWGLIVDLWGASALVWAFYFLDDNKVGLFYTCCILTMACKEALAILVLSMGVWIWIKNRNKRLAISTFCLGGIWLIVSILLKNYLNMGWDVHSMFKDQLLNLLSNPKELIIYFTNPKRLMTVIQILGPFGFICLACPSMIAVSVPFLGLLFLNPKMTLIRDYYFAPIIPFFVTAVVYGVGSIIKKLSNRKSITKALAVFLFVNSIWTFIFYNPFNVNSQYRQLEHEDTPHKKLVRMKVSEIPKDKVVSITPELRSLIAENRISYIFPRDPVRNSLLKTFKIEPYESSVTRDADYVIVDIQQRSHSEFPPEGPKIQELLKKNIYGIIYIHDGLIIFKKGMDRLEGLRNIFVDKSRVRGRVLNKEYSNGLTLLAVESDLNKGIRRGEGIDLTLYYKINQKIDKNFQILVNFKRVGSNKITWLHAPLFRLVDCREWNVGDIVRDSFIIPVGKQFVIGNNPYKVDIEVLQYSDSKSSNTSEIIDELMILPTF